MYLLYIVTLLVLWHFWVGYRRVLEMCCSVQGHLAQTLADFELKLEKEVLEPLSKLSEVSPWASKTQLCLRSY